MPLPVMKMPKIEDDIMLFQGGLDLTTPNLKLRAGHVRSSANWQAVANEDGGGYERVGGYERFTGQASPSSFSEDSILLMISSWILQPSTWHSSASDLVAVRLTGATSGAQVLLRIYTAGGLVRFTSPFEVAAGSDFYEGQPYLIVGSTTFLEFQAGETLDGKFIDIAGNESASFSIAVIESVGTASAILSQKTYAKLRASRADGARANLSAPPGAGKILGVVSLVSSNVRTVYVWRNADDGLSATIYKSSNTGWQAVPLYLEIRFTAGGTAVPAEGATLTQGVVTTTIKRVVQESGDWGSNTAAGRLIVTTSSGGYFTAGAATIGAITLTLGGTATAITLLPNGVYQFHVANFSGQLSSNRIYGADGVNRGFEFDGDVLVPIETKAIQDTPSFVRKHHNHLVLAIGSSIMISGPGTPYKFANSTGGMELATGDTVSGLLVQPGDQSTAALAVFGRNSTGILYGTSASDFSYKALTTMTGSLPYMHGNLDQSYVFDDRGVISLAAAQEYGNFKQATLTANIAKFLMDRKKLSVAACVSTDRSQFRLFFSDGSALYLTIVNSRLIGAMPQQFYHPFSCIWNAEDANGNEETFAGGTDGMVYQLDKGSSFDGVAISHYLVFTPNFIKSPSIKKQFRNGNLEIDATDYAEFSVGYSLRYGDSHIFQPLMKDTDNSLRPIPEWDSFIWDNFVWDGMAMGPIPIEIKGKSEVIQMIIAGSSTYVYPFRLSSLTTHYTLTRRIR